MDNTTRTPGRGDSRRRFLKTVSAIAIGATGASMIAALPGCKSPDDSGPEQTPTTGQKVTLALASEASLATVGGFIRRAFGTNNGGKDVIVVRLAATGTAAFKTMSVICTHQGCAVNSPTNGVIGCPCHGSTFGASASNFATVLGGPATTPLQTYATTFDGTIITITF